MNKTKQHKKAILEALEKSLGVVSSACKAVGVGRTTFYGWLKEDEEFAKKVKDIENFALDFVETQLFKQIKEGSPAATIFYLKTKGRKRGYIEQALATDINIKLNLEPDFEIETDRLIEQTTEEIAH